MHTTAFPRPVTALVGLGFPRRVADAREALAFLEDQAPMMHDEAYEATRQVCLEAVAGVAAIEEAHDVFAAFLRRRGILLEESPPSLVADRPREGLAA